MNLRHIDDGVGKLQFYYADQWVLCPDCGTKGIVHYRIKHSDSEETQCKKHFIFTCSHCNRNLDSSSPQYNLEFNAYYEITVHEACHFCGGSRLTADKKIINIKNPQAFAEAECSVCHKISKLIVNSKNIYIRKADRLAHTVFGLQLCLVANTRSGNIYLHNLEHLQELKSYVQAGLRERTQNTGNSSYYSRLPAWIKSARNRKEILKALLRLEQMATTIQP